jgi:signal peptidase I
VKINWVSFGKICYYLLVGAIALIAILVIVSVLPLPGNYNLYVVKSGSMAPALQAGDLIFTRQVEEYQKGDIITFLPPTTSSRKDSVTHRIIDKKDQEGTETFQTKGDANEAPDGHLITSDQIVGKYTFRIPILGYPVGFAKTVVGLVILIIIPAVVIIYDEIYKIKRELNRKARKDKK